MSDVSIGVDFGTTNTVVAIAERGQPVRMVAYPRGEALEDVYRSVLCFEREDFNAAAKVERSAGPYAIERYLASVGETRFIQSFKSHVASGLFRDTRIFSTKFLFEDLLASFFQLLLDDARGQIPLGATIVSGRPVAFAGGNPDEALAHKRYDAAYAKAGLGQPTHVYEPVGAAYYYAQRLKHDATILVGDFGGGTSDFSILRFERSQGALRVIPMGHAGVGVAGDSFDYRIINAVVSPRLGKGSQYRSMGKAMDVPSHYYANFARWHQLALLKSPENQRELEKLRKVALRPDQIGDLMDIINNDWGFDIYRAVS
ncbi:MAG: Hsp70 family protein, partial [Bosea sp. (in: a-proteobacteria)]